MNVISNISDTRPDARCIETSKRLVLGNIVQGVSGGAKLRYRVKSFFKMGLFLADTFTTMSVDEKRFAVDTGPHLREYLWLVRALHPIVPRSWTERGNTGSRQG